MRILLISPYHSGSHQQWAEGYAQHSEHDVRLLTLPGKFWKWRMQGGAVTLARQFNLAYADSPPDLLIVDDMLDLTTFLALTRQQTRDIPIALYMHENQLTYPLHRDKTQGAMRRRQGKRNRHLVFINYSSMLAAQHIYFNSTYHLESWFAALPNFLKNYPDYNELETIAQLRAKSHVLYVGVDALRVANGDSVVKSARAPLILWNQRWEYDKDPETFLRALLVLHERDVNFRVAFCGENFSQDAAAFDKAIATLGEKVMHVGFASAEKYAYLLQQTSVTFSTAQHEFFGISMVEAMLAGASLLLPRRLSYPELVPEQLHHAVFYDDFQMLVGKLEQLLQGDEMRRQIGRTLKAHAQQFTWTTLAPQYDQAFTSTLNKPLMFL